MNARLAGWLILLLALGATAIYLLRGEAPATADDGAAGPLRPQFSLPDLDGRMHDIAEWDGKVLLINFWATWCPPCREEIPDFIEVRKAYHDRGFEIVGVAIDNPDSVRDYVDVLEIDYPILHGSAEATAISQRYGNRSNALPYSVLLDRQGHIRFSGAGRLPRQSLEQAVQQLLAE